MTGLTAQAAPILITGNYNQSSGVVNANGLLVAEGTASTETATMSNSGTVLNLTTDPGNFTAVVNVAGNPNSPNATGTLNVLSGALLIIDGTPDITATGALHGLSTARTSTSNATVLIDGAGSRVLLKGNSGFFNLAASSVSDSGTASLRVTNGAVIEGGGGANDFVTFNAGGGTDTAGAGSVLIDGVGSRVSLRGAFGLGSGNEGAAASVNIGRGTGTGSLTVSAGGQLSIDTTGVATTTAPTLNVGSNRATATGTLIVDGMASRVVIISDGLNPGLSVGRLGNGTLNIMNGGVLQLNGKGAASADNFNSTFVNIGGASGVTAGGTGSALISGPGSRLEINGTNGVLTVGRGGGANGAIVINNGGAVNAPVILLAGVDGGIGSLTVNNGSIALSGIQQFGTTPNTGPSFVLGRSGGVGSLSMINGSTVSLTAPSTAQAFTAVSLGGTSVNVQGGTGSLSMSSGSRLTVSGGSSNSGVFVGRIGTGTMTVRDQGTVVDVSGVTGGGRVLVGVEPFGVNTGTGTLVVSNNGFVNAGTLLGVAHNGVTSSGGTGTLSVNSGARVCANSIYVGNKGTITGNGGTLCGNVVSNQGLISIGNSVGTMTVEGGYKTVDSGKFLLEIESVGNGGFVTDTMVFKGITANDLSFADSLFEFSFLSDSDPNAALGLLNLAQFFLYDDGSGNLQGIDALGVSLDELFAEVDFLARSDGYVINSFEYTPSGGFVMISATAVPEPSTLLLLWLAVFVLWRLQRTDYSRPVS